MIILSQHRSILKILFLHAEGQLRFGVDMLGVPMDIIILWLFLICIQDLRTVDM